jgi:ABC-type nitrate/sulfonate/bicarbonate transport system substrate-binding protein
MVALSRRRLATLATAFAFAFAWTTASLAQQRPKISVSSLTLPVFNPIVWNIMKARGFDAKHGFELDIKAYPSISAFYAAFSTGETEALIGGPTIFQKLYQEGVPLRIFGTGFTLSDLVIFARDPNIKSLADSKASSSQPIWGDRSFRWSRSMPM